MTAPEPDLRLIFERLFNVHPDWDNVADNTFVDPPDVDMWVSDNDAERWQRREDSRTVDVFGGGRA